MNSRSKLIRAVEYVKNEYKEKHFKELELLTKNSCTFSIVYEKIEYGFEVEARKIDKNKLCVMILGEKKKMFTIGFSKYFTIDTNGSIIETDEHAF